HVFTQYPGGSEPKDSIQIDLAFKQIDFNGTYQVRDLWAGKDLGEYTDSLSLFVKNHGARLVRIGAVE
ncbi:MAG: hypothetical protein ACOC0C_05815, partial [Bacteroidota bacterium]